MEVDTDDEFIESTHLNHTGPLPDVTHNLPRGKQSKHISQTLKPNSLNSSLFVSPTKLNRTNEHQPLLNGNTSDDQMDYSDFVHLSCNHFDSDPEFNDFVKKVEFAIDHNILPQRIYEGSSGSYFCKNSDNV